MRSEELLAKAAEIVAGPRAVDYGPKLTNHARIADLWNMWLLERRGHCATIDPYDVGIMMLLVKVARLMNAPGHPDSHLDIAGYAAVVEEIWEDMQRMEEMEGEP